MFEFLGVFKSKASSTPDRCLNHLLIKRLDLALQFDRQRVAPAIHLIAYRRLDPPLADEVLRDIESLLVIEPDTDVMFEHGSDVMRAARFDRQVIERRGKLGSVV